MAITNVERTRETKRKIDFEPLVKRIKLTKCKSGKIDIKVTIDKLIVSVFSLKGVNR